MKPPRVLSCIIILVPDDGDSDASKTVEIPSFLTLATARESFIATKTFIEDIFSSEVNV